MNVLGAFLTVVFCGLAASLPRRLSAVSIVAAVCYLSQAQAINLLGFNYTAIRCVLTITFLRVIARGEFAQWRLNRLDWAVIAYAAAVFIIPVLRDRTPDSLTFNLGVLYNIVLSYAVFRSLVQSREDIIGILTPCALVIAPFAVTMLYEKITGRNFYYILGGVAEYSLVRDGSTRCQGPFRSPITAGSFGATFALFYIGMWFAGIKRTIAAIGLFFSLLITVCAHSSGPLLGFQVGVLALAIWRVRQHTRKIRWAIVITLVTLHLIMKAPVWFLIARLGDLVGGGGYHRAALIDAFVASFRNWWFIGTTETGSWMPTQLASGDADLTNQFVADGVTAGLLGLILSVRVFVIGFKHLGGALRDQALADPSVARFIWSVGAILTATIAIIFSVCYFDQLQVIYYFMLSCVAVLGATTYATAPVPTARAPLPEERKATAYQFP